MAFFKFRKDGEEPTAPASAPESVETLRKRARYRLAGAAVLVLAGVIGFPLLFDNQPRPIAVDIPIVIPDKEQARSAPLPGASQAHFVAESASGAEAPATAQAGRASEAKVITESKPTGDARPRSEARVITEPKAVAEPKAAADAKASGESKSTGDGARAQALLDGKTGSGKAGKSAASDKSATKPSASDSGRFVVQFGSFSDAARAHEARVKVERAGFKTYAQVAQGPDGKRFRVRVGPFAQRGEAEKAAEKIKKLDLAVSILAL